MKSTFFCSTRYVKRSVSRNARRFSAIALVDRKALIAMKPTETSDVHLSSRWGATDYLSGPASKSYLDLAVFVDVSR